MRMLTTLVLAGASVAAQAEPMTSHMVRSLNPVVQWNRTLLSIVRTPGAQPPTVHPTRSFAMLHAAIYDAVNAIDRGHVSYLVSVPHASRRGSQDAAALGGQGKTGHLSTLQNRPFPVSGIEAD